eukprot:GHVN01050479.1.p2 GENE.GHVN01050479.1~~GHVN01050479.1.p2  ORF type:complete len:309 (-),score=19.92 GHVN01050479.1:1673-2599(-)
MSLNHAQPSIKYEVPGTSHGEADAPTDVFNGSFSVDSDDYDDHKRTDPRSVSSCFSHSGRNVLLQPLLDTEHYHQFVHHQPQRYDSNLEAPPECAFKEEEGTSLKTGSLPSGLPLLVSGAGSGGVWDRWRASIQHDGPLNFATLGGQEFESDQMLPMANIGRIMKRVVPENAKIAKDAKECLQQCVYEFVQFVTGEACDKCINERRKTLNADDLLAALDSLGFDRYIEPMRRYLARWRGTLPAITQKLGQESKFPQATHSSDAFSPTPCFINTPLSYSSPRLDIRPVHLLNPYGNSKCQMEPTVGHLL